ncbi:MAG: phage holin family protein [Armatimonadetes bacterium]|nr:phage holin family protein [Armatimonadota bacterium]MCX7969603.1 phage holin family protein [Armatimonadota bacterium]MDW8144382.1 phage holin family protein [Armatimonadota bacterium]
METVKSLVYRFVWNALALFLLAKGVYGNRVEISGFGAAFLVVLVIALAQALIRPALFLFRVVTFPLNLLTLGLLSFVFGLVLNAIVFFLIGQTNLISGFHVKDFGAAFGMTLLYSIANAVGNMLFGKREKG